jgi:hypothetical protein
VTLSNLKNASACWPTHPHPHYTRTLPAIHRVPQSMAFCPSSKIGLRTIIEVIQWDVENGVLPNGWNTTWTYGNNFKIVRKV